MMRTSSRFLAMLGLLTATTGCTSMNESVGLLDTEPLPALTTDNQSMLSGEPSLVGVDRRSWEPQTVRVVLHQTEHHPRMSTDYLIHDSTARQRGEYPDATSALVTEQTGLTHAGEAALNAGGFLVGLVAEPIKLLLKGRSPWTVTRDSPRSFEAIPADAAAAYDARWVTPPTGMSVSSDSEAQP